MDAFCEFDGNAFASKTVPLVVYENGERRVVGEATLRTDKVGFVLDGRITDPDTANRVSGIGVVTRFPTDGRLPEGENPMTEQS